MYLIEIIFSEPQILIRNLLRMVHFLGLAIGLGTATMLDLMILKFFMGRTVCQQKCEVLAFCARIVTWGLITLWVSGAGFMLYYWHFDPTNLMNEKIYAKIAIVGILTINGIFIHRVFLPFLISQTGKALLADVPRWRRHMLVTSAVISAVSWYCPLLIANLPQLNFTVPMLEIMGVYALFLGCVLLLAHFVLIITTPDEIDGPSRLQA